MEKSVGEGNALSSYHCYVILWEDDSQDEPLLAMLLPLLKTCVNIPPLVQIKLFFLPSLLAIKKKASDPK